MSFSYTINDNDKYLLLTKIQYNNDNKRQNILRERNILYLRKQTRGSLKFKPIAQKPFVKHRTDRKNNINQTDSCPGN